MAMTTSSNRWGGSLLLAVAWFGAAFLAAPLAAQPGAVPQLWPPAGIGLAVLLLWGQHLWPGVLLGAILAGFLLGYGWPVALALGAGAALECSAAAELVRRHVGVPKRFRQVADVLKLLCCCAAAATISGTVMAAALAAGRPVDWGSLLWDWWSWWQADLLGMLVFAPLVLAFSRWPPVTWPPARRVEIVMYTALLLLLGAGMLGGPGMPFHPARFPFVVLPLIMWSAVRFGQRAVTFTTAFASVAAAWSVGPFAGAAQYEAQLMMLLYVCIVAATGLVVSAVVRDRRDVMKELSGQRDQLEQRVRERTLELAHANRALHSDIAARSIAESRLKESELRVRLMVDGIVDYAIYLLDPAGHITSWNSGAQRIKGYRAEEIIGEHVSRFYTPEQARDGKPARELEAAAAEGRFYEESWRVRKDGSRFWAGVLVAAIRDDAGRLVGFTKITRDLTERRQYEAQLMQAKAAAEKANEAKSEFLARMSHELRTPLNSLLILARLLADNATSNLTPRQVRYAETIYGAGSDLLVLIDDILDLARVESGAVNTVVVAPAAVAEVIDFLESTFRQLAHEKGIQFAIAADAGTAQYIETDVRRLQQILKNLLSNAFKFTQRGSVTLRIHAGEPGRICFSASDTGIGIPEDKQQVIFEAFKQADDATSRQYGGSGLGLAISREFARLLGGEIRLSSRPGVGSTFTLCIPSGTAPEPRELPGAAELGRA